MLKNEISTKPGEFSLIIITDENKLPGDPGLINTLFENGLDYLYLRCKSEDLFKIISLTGAVSLKFQRKLILFTALGEEINIPDAVFHLKEAERREAVLKKNELNRKYSTSIHDLDELEQMPEVFKLVFYSPVFESISKKGYKPSNTLSFISEKLKTLQHQKENMPAVIALGGITAANITQVKAAGFNGAALLGAIWESPSPLVAFEEIKAALLKV